MAPLITTKFSELSNNTPTTEPIIYSTYSAVDPTLNSVSLYITVSFLALPITPPIPNPVTSLSSAFLTTTVTFLDLRSKANKLSQEPTKPPIYLRNMLEAMCIFEFVTVTPLRFRLVAEPTIIPALVI